jgi:hypothetical protein
MGIRCFLPKVILGKKMSKGNEISVNGKCAGSIAKFCSNMEKDRSDARERRQPLRRKPE